MLMIQPLTQTLKHMSWQTPVLWLTQVMMVVEGVMAAGMGGVGMDEGVTLTEGDEEVGGGYKVVGKRETLITLSLAREVEKVVGAKAALGDVTPDVCKW